MAMSESTTAKDKETLGFYAEAALPGGLDSNYRGGRGVGQR